MKRLRFFPDYGADPVWDGSDGAMVDLDGLPVRSETRQALRAWRARWETLAWQQMRADDLEAGMSDQPAVPVADDQWSEVEREGQLLCAQLQQELGPDWIVDWEGI